MIKVTIPTQAVRVRNTSTGKMTLQKMQINQKDGFPLVFETVVDSALPAGEYEFEPVFQNDQYGGLQLNRYEINLVRVKSS